jgi:hypothetical protein
MALTTALINQTALCPAFHILQVMTITGNIRVNRKIETKDILLVVFNRTKGEMIQKTLG